jgi:mono/diheme cytochrome c family protein
MMLACATPPSETPTAWTSSSGDDRKTMILAGLERGVVADGAVLYAEGCAQCHLADGSGAEPFPSLVDTMPGLEDEALVDVLYDGLPNPAGGVGMPPYAAVYTNQQFVDVIAYLRASFAR